MSLIEPDGNWSRWVDLDGEASICARFSRMAGRVNRYRDVQSFLGAQGAEEDEE